MKYFYSDGLGLVERDVGFDTPEQAKIAFYDILLHELYDRKEKEKRSIERISDKIESTKKILDNLKEEFPEEFI